MYPQGEQFPGKEVQADPGAKNVMAFDGLNCIYSKPKPTIKPPRRSIWRPRTSLFQGKSRSTPRTCTGSRSGPKRSALSAGIGQTGHRLPYRGEKPVIGWADQQNSPHRELSQPFLILSASTPVQEQICHRCLLTNSAPEKSVSDKCQFFWVPGRPSTQTAQRGHGRQLRSSPP